MQYLASSPRHMPTHTNTRRRGSNPPFLLSLRSQAQQKAKRRKKQKTRFAPVRPVTPAIIPDCFIEVGRFLRWLRLGSSRSKYSVTQILIKSRRVITARDAMPDASLLPFLRGSLRGHAPRHNLALRPAPIALTLAAALIAQQGARFIARAQSPSQVCAVHVENATRRSAAAG